MKPQHCSYGWYVFNPATGLYLWKDGTWNKHAISIKGGGYWPTKKAAKEFLNKQVKG